VSVLLNLDDACSNFIVNHANVKLIKQPLKFQIVIKKIATSIYAERKTILMRMAVFFCAVFFLDGIGTVNFSSVSIGKVPYPKPVHELENLLITERLKNVLELTPEKRIKKFVPELVVFTM